ncbi:hypothetical protein CRG98_030714 [Punica granatum]|uniref:PRP1 splicing factor N-terminal domain-containing protein n=1 Tax=Punica granatum TaxID=22663 RepID=A0A2I0IZM3_PUNGR|nr:hypothetical protein CRG98_030714 [Punica granatum]
MPPKRKDRVEDVHDRENLRHLEQRLDHMDQMDQRMEHDKGYDENWKFDEFEGNDVGLFAYAEYDEDDKEADAVWEAIDKRMDSRRKDRREARLEEEIEKYHAPNQQMRTMMSDVSIEPITATKYFELGFFPIIRSEAWADIGFRSSMEDMELKVVVPVFCGINGSATGHSRVRCVKISVGLRLASSPPSLTVLAVWVLEMTTGSVELPDGDSRLDPISS